MYITIWYDLQECGKIVEGVCCEELVGVTHRTSSNRIIYG